MLNLTNYSLNPKDEQTLQQIEIHLQSLSFDKKAAIAIAALYEATEPSTIHFDYICDRCPNLNQSIALLQELSKDGLFAVARAIAEELAVLKKLQGASR